MKIDLVESGITFSEIGCGQCFEFEGIIYMRVASNHIEHDYGYAARLIDGFISKINVDAQVRKLNLKVVEDTDSQ